MLEHLVSAGAVKNIGQPRHSVFVMQPGGREAHQAIAGSAGGAPTAKHYKRLPPKLAGLSGTQNFRERPGMNDSLNNKELVAVGHQYAKAMSSDTPIIDMA